MQTKLTPTAKQQVKMVGTPRARRIQLAAQPPRSSCHSK